MLPVIIILLNWAWLEILTRSLSVTLNASSAFVFGMIIATISCYQGFNTEGGAEGVGKATTGAVVISSMLILISDYFLTSMLF